MLTIDSALRQPEPPRIIFSMKLWRSSFGAAGSSFGAVGSFGAMGLQEARSDRLRPPISMERKSSRWASPMSSRLLASDDSGLL